MHDDPRNKFIISFIKKQFGEDDNPIALHEPRFIGNEKKYVTDAINSTFVSSVGKYVDLFEEMIKKVTGADYAIAVVNGTAALHVALLLAGVKPGDEVITQPLTFIATANAITYAGGRPVFIDVDRDTLGLSPTRLKDFLIQNTEIKGDKCYNKSTGNRISACVPMHTFGLPSRIDQITEICKEYKIAVVEDAAESLGSTYKGKHTGTFGLLGTFSFNGNKTVTCGGGGAIVTNDESLGKMAKHLTTTAKIPHKWEYIHDMVGYNYRMPNLNAALGCAQLEQLEKFIRNKRELARHYKDFFDSIHIPFIEEIEEAKSNYWLMTILLGDSKERNALLEDTHRAGIMTRPAWLLMNKLEMYKSCQADDLKNARWLEDRIINIPSSVRVDKINNIIADE